MTRSQSVSASASNQTTTAERASKSRVRELLQCAAPDGEHSVGPAGDDVADGALFGTPKPHLALGGEDARDVDSGVGFDALVGVDEAAVEPGGKITTDRALARTHISGEDDPRHRRDAYPRTVAR